MSSENLPLGIIILSSLIVAITSPANVPKFAALIILSLKILAAVISSSSSDSSSSSLPFFSSSFLLFYKMVNCIFYFGFLLFLLFLLFLQQISFIVWYVEPHFTKDITFITILIRMRDLPLFFVLQFDCNFILSRSSRESNITVWNRKTSLVVDIKCHLILIKNIVSPIPSLKCLNSFHQTCARFKIIIYYWTGKYLN